MTQFKKNASIYCWGDSLTAGAGSGTYSGVPYPTSLNKILTGQYTVYNRGVGGETTKTILSRQGSMSMLVQPTVVIPGDGSTVEVSLLADDGGTVRPLLQSSASQAGLGSVWINDTEVVLTVTVESGSTNVKYYLKRKTSGDAITIDRPTSLRCSGWYNKSEILILYIGQNGGYDSIDELIYQYKKAIDYNGTSKYILLGLTSGSSSSRADLEQKMFDNFGKHYINLRDYLSTYAMYDYGLTPTETDISQMSQGIVPDSLRIDGVHGNAYYYDTITRLIFKRGIDFGYWTWTDYAKECWSQTIIK